MMIPNRSSAQTLLPSDPGERLTLVAGGGQARRSATLVAEAALGLEELTDCLYFAPNDGRIWLDQQRMVMLNVGVLGAMRREMVQAVGLDRARAMLERVGYEHGRRDAELVRKRWGECQPATQWDLGPRLHALQGFLKTTTLSFDCDLEQGHFHGEFLWEDCAEADEHLAVFGVADAPCCHLSAAYASGFASTQFGLLIQFREVQCRGQGDPCCRVAARTAAEWGFDERTLGAFNSAAPALRGEVGSAALAASPQAPSVIGLSAPFIAARSQLEKVAPTVATVLLRGESGTGKELFANTLHQLSDRRSGPFIAVNCAAIPEELVESELFGVERGAFTGATVSRAGRFERAHGGTLFLDEISSMSAAAQGKLLRALQERRIERVGGSASVAVNVRVVAATNVDLWQEVAQRRFRQDLFFRLNVFPIDLPALRQRRDDVPFLLEHFLAVYCRDYGKQVRGFTHRAMSALLNYDYPGNVRELQNLVERGVICADPDGLIDSAQIFRPGERTAGGEFGVGPLGRLGRLTSESAPAPQADAAVALVSASPPVSDRLPPSSLAVVERQLCQDALQACSGNVAAAARQLGLSRPTLEYRLRKWGLLPTARSRPLSSLTT